MSVLVSLIFSVLSTIEEYETFANKILYWLVKTNLKRDLHNFIHIHFTVIQRKCSWFLFLDLNFLSEFGRLVAGKNICLIL